VTTPALIGSLDGAFRGSGDPARRAPADASAEMSVSLRGAAPGTSLPPPPALDTAALNRLVARFSNLDLSGIDRAVAGASGSVTIEVPDAQALLGRAAALGKIAGTLRGEAAAALLDRLRAGPPADAGSGMASVEASLGQLAGLRSNTAVRSVLDALRPVIPADVDLDAPTTRIGEALATGRDLVTVVGAMMAIDTAATELRDTAAIIHGLVAPRTIDALISRARVWANSDSVVNAIANVTDPEDPLQVGVAERALASVEAAFSELAGTLARVMGFGEATLVHEDPAARLTTIDAAAARLRATGMGRVRTQAQALAAALEPLVPTAAGLPLAPAWDGATTLAGQLATAIGGLSADPLVRPVQQALGAVTSALDQINQVFGEVSGALRGAFGTVRRAAAAIDLQSVARAVTSFLQPLVDVLRELDALLATVMGALEALAAQLAGVVRNVKDVLVAGTGSVRQAFEAVAQLVHELKLDALIDALRGGLQEIANALHQIQLQPYFDTSIEVMAATSDVLSAVPFGLLPDSAKQELEAAIRPIQSIDFQADVASVLKAELHAILARLDTEALAALDDAFAQVAAFLETLDPAPLLSSLDDELDAFLTNVRAIDPEAILAPAADAIERIRRELGRIDLRARVLAPIERVFDRLAATLDQVNPAPLLQPIEDQVAGIRQRILELAHLDRWSSKLEDVHQLADGWLARVDPAALGPRLDAVVDAALAAAPAPSDGSLVGGLVASLVGGLGLRARPQSFTAVLGWMTGDDGAARVRALVASAAAALARSLATVRSFDLRAIAAELDLGYRHIRTAVTAHPPGSLLRLRLDPIVVRIAPLDTIGALGGSHEGYVAALDAASHAVHAYASHGQSELTAAAASVRDAFRPLAATRGRVLALGRSLGVDLSGRDLRGVLAPLFTSLRPSRVLELFGPVIGALRDKLRETLVDGLIAPVQAGIAEIRAAIDQLDVSIFRTELTALFEHVQAELEALRPSIVLAPALAALEDFTAHLAAYDPLAPVRATLDATRAAIDELGQALRPSILLRGVTSTYQEILRLVQGLNVRTLAEPVLSALADIEIQLGGGLDGTAAAMADLQASLRGLGTAGGSVTVTVSGGFS
jgi:hypothetical protein